MIAFVGEKLMLLLGLKRLIERMTDQCWNGYMAGEI